MDFLIELIFELIFDGTIEISKNRKVPKIIRYPLIAIIVMFFAAIIIGLFIIGIIFMKDNILVGILCIVVSIIFLISAIIKFKKVYLERIWGKTWVWYKLLTLYW